MPRHRDGVEVFSRAQLAGCPHWANAFAGERKDHRYYELVEDTLRDGFEYRYFAIKDAQGEVRTVQPFFMLDQDLLVGASPKLGALIHALRRVWPRFLKLRTLMVGCPAGEGQLDGDESSYAATAQLLAAAIVAHARALRAPLIVLKEFPAKYRRPLTCFLHQGFSRVPSLPMTRLNIQYQSFEDYMTQALTRATRRKLRKKFRAAAQAPPLEMSLLDNIAPVVDDLYSLYLQVYARSKLRFEKLTKDYFCQIGRRMPDKVRFFVWRQEGRIVAFSLCLVEREAFYAEYIGLDYSVALRLHLYHYAVRDMTAWAMANGYQWLRSSSLNYDPKLHLRHVLDPLDLYVRHTAAISNVFLQWLLPFIEPTRYDRTLQKFPNYHDLWSES